MASPANPPTSFLDLPTEIRLAILEYVFEASPLNDGFTNHNHPGGLLINHNYTATTTLSPLLTCRQIHHDSAQLALSRTPFLITDLYSKLPQRLSLLRKPQQRAIRDIAVVAGARQMRDMGSWGPYPFGCADLTLRKLTIVLHRSAHWLYLGDFTADVVRLLRNLGNVDTLVFVRNGANVKGHFRTWCNRLVGLVLKEDHRCRFDVVPPVLEGVWWSWVFDEVGEWFRLVARGPKPVMGEGEYMEVVRPLVEELMRGMEREEWDPDPRARNGWG